MSHTQLVIQFAKAPVVGRVKTRLIPHLGAEKARQLHWDMTRDFVESFSCVENLFEFELHVDDVEHDEVIQLASRNGCTLRRQSEGNLGQRMSVAFEQALNSYKHVVLIGSDCPAITAVTLNQLFESLVHNDVAILPATDGGYAAIAMRSFLPNLFIDIAWGTDTVFSATIERIEGKVDYQLLPVVSDIDSAEDLQRYADHRIIKNYL